MVAGEDEDMPVGTELHDAGTRQRTVDEIEGRQRLVFDDLLQKRFIGTIDQRRIELEIRNELEALAATVKTDVERVVAGNDRIKGFAERSLSSKAPSSFNERTR